MEFPNSKSCFAIDSEEAFNNHALELFHFQSKNVLIYEEFLKAIHFDKRKVKNWKDIPFLPISFFKSHKVFVKGQTIKRIFSSSGTTGMITSSHYVSNIKMYEESFLKSFELFYGNPNQYCIIALLPSYLEREGSSLVYMADQLIKKSGHISSGFYLDQYAALSKLLQTLNKNHQPTILIGVTFALLDLVENFSLAFPNLILIETGGMKGRRKELIREELHSVLKTGFKISSVHSEYGMTELLSQAYSKKNGVFYSPPWMKIVIREINDPFVLLPNGKTGGINIIDLANVNSCSFIATQDLGRLNFDDGFEVLGRFDNSDLRGCNLLIQ